MPFEYASALAAVFALVAGGIAASSAVQKLFLSAFGKEKPPQSYAQRLSKLTASLTKASTEVDDILSELTRVAADREEAATKLESELAEMHRREQEIKKNIEVLQDVPITVAEHFAKLVEPAERRNARRDYLLFGAGVLVTTIITTIMQVLTRQ